MHKFYNCFACIAWRALHVFLSSDGSWPYAHLLHVLAVPLHVTQLATRHVRHFGLKKSGQIKHKHFGVETKGKNGKNGKNGA